MNNGLQMARSILQPTYFYILCLGLSLYCSKCPLQLIWLVDILQGLCVLCHQQFNRRVEQHLPWTRIPLRHKLQQKRVTAWLPNADQGFGKLIKRAFEGTGYFRWIALAGSVYGRRQYFMEPGFTKIQATFTNRRFSGYVTRKKARKTDAIFMVADCPTRADLWQPEQGINSNRDQQNAHFLPRLQ